MSGLNPLQHQKNDFWNTIILICLLLLPVCFILLFVPGEVFPFRTLLLLTTVSFLNVAMFMKDRNNKK